MRWLTALALLAPTAGAAPADPDVRYPDGTKATRAEIARKYQDVAGKDKAVVDAYFRVAAGGVRPLSRPDPKAEPSGAPALPFLKMYNRLGTYEQGPGGKYYLLATGSFQDENPGILGWVPEVCLIRDTERECMRDPASTLAVRAMVINSLRFLKAKADGVPDEARAAPPRFLLAPPPLTGLDNGPARFFDFYYVWADTDPEHEDRGHALIAESPAVPPGELSDDDFRRQSRILGWVDKRRLCFWRTREAVQWDDLTPGRTNPGKAFATREHAKSELDPGRYPAPPAAAADPPVLERFDNGGPARWKPDQMRFPVLSIRVPDPRGPAFATLQPNELVGKNVLRRVGVIGDVYDDKGQPVMTEAARQQIQLDITRAREQLKRTEVLFVIDRTESMRNWWGRTADAVDRLIDLVNREKRSVAVGFCFYGDVNPGAVNEGKAVSLKEVVDKEGVRPGRLLDVRADAAALKAALHDLRDTSKMMAGGGPLEAVYAGLEIGLMEAKGWSKNARKLVILLGDDGNHRLPPADERAVHDRIAELLVPTPDPAAGDYETPIEFYAIQACRVADDPASPTATFKTQVEALVGRVNARSPAAQAKYFNTADEKAFHVAIDKRYEDLKKRADGTEATLQQVQYGRFKTVTEIQDPEAAGILRRIASDRKLAVDDLLKGVQAFDERYVWEDDPKTGMRQLRNMILVTDGELERVVKMFENYFKNRENPEPLEKLAEQLIGVQAGGKELTHAERRAGLDKLKVKHGFSFTDALAKHLGYDLPEKVAPPARDEKSERRLRQHLQKRFLLLQDIQAERVHEYVRINPADEVGLQRVLPGRPLGPGERRVFPDVERSEMNEMKYYWIDFDREWP